jgi:hypothetical protein
LPLAQAKQLALLKVQVQLLHLMLQAAPQYWARHRL